MADETLNIQIQVNAETGQLEIVSKGLENAGNKAKEASTGFTGLSSASKELLGTLGGLLSLGAITKFMADSVKEAEQEILVLKRLEFGLQSNGVSWEANKTKVIEWGEAIKANTRFSDDQAYNSLDRMVRVTGNLAQAQATTKLAMDLSVASGKSLEDTLATVVDLYNGNARALIQLNREYGSFAGGAKDTRQALINLQEKVGGLSESEQGLTRDTLNLKNEFSDLQKQLGKDLTPAFKFLIDLARDGITWFDRLTTAIASTGLVVVNLVSTYNSAVKAIVTGHFGDLKNIANEFFSAHKVAIEENVKAWEKGDEKKTQSTKTNTTIRGKMSNAETEKEEEEIDKRLQQLMKDEEARANIYRELQKEEQEINRLIAEDEKKKNDERRRLIAEDEKKKNDERRASAQAVARNIAQEFGQAFQQVITESKTVDQAFTQMFQNMINMIIQTIAQMLILKMLTGSVTGGGTGGLFGAMGFLAEGGEAKAGKSYIVGENGPEILKMGATGGEVIPNKRIKEVVPSVGESASGGGAVTVNVNVSLSAETLSVDNSQAIIKALASEVGQKTGDSVRLALQMQNLAKKNSGKAV